VLVIECKNANKDEAIALGADQIRRYHRETPELFVSRQLSTATDPMRFSCRRELEQDAADHFPPETDYLKRWTAEWDDKPRCRTSKTVRTNRRHRRSNQTHTTLRT